MSYSRALNRELKTKGIRMMSMNPAWVKTEFFDHAIKLQVLGVKLLPHRLVMNIWMKQQKHK